MISFPFAASFYGSSHAALPLADARSTTSISFRLRTSRPEALIVLAAGRVDYCLVMMQGGAIKVSTQWEIIFTNNDLWQKNDGGLLPKQTRYSHQENKVGCCSWWDS